MPKENSRQLCIFIRCILSLNTVSSGSFLEFFGNRLVFGEDSKVEKVEALGEELISLRVLEYIST